MKRSKIVAFTVLLLLAASSYGQSIETKRGRYYVEGNRMNASEIITLMEPYPEAHKLMRAGVATSYLSLPVAVAGSSLIVAGWMEGVDLFGEEAEANYIMIGVGSALTLVGVIMAASASSQRTSAIQLYNSSVKGDAFHSAKTNWQLKVTGSGLKVSVKF